MAHIPNVPRIRPAGIAAGLSDLARRANNRRRAAVWTLRANLVARRARREDARGGTDAPRGEPFPAFDARGFNPVGWRRDSDGETAALGSLDLLPPGISAGKTVGARDLRRLRRAASVVDGAAFHDDDASRAAVLSRLAAAGVIVHVADDAPRLEALLGERLHRLVAADPRGLDAFSREIRAVRASRESMRLHSAWARERLRGERDFPLVSVLLATMRPRFLEWALDGVAKQTYPRIELILALHGDGFDDAERVLAQFPRPLKTLRITPSRTLGAALNAASEAASGRLLTKMDDDDFYDPEHVWDLVLARAYSGADLVAKGLEWVYLAASDRTVYRRERGGERYWTHSVAGGTMLISRRALARAGGWRDIPSGVDVALLADALRSGARIYRASGIGYILVRHGERHTWRDDEATAKIFSKAERVWDGLRLDAAGVAAPNMPRPAPGGGRE